MMERRQKEEGVEAQEQSGNEGYCGNLRRKGENKVKLRCGKTSKRKITTGEGEGDRDKNEDIR